MFPKNQPTSGWLLSSSRKTLPSICSSRGLGASSLCSTGLPYQYGFQEVPLLQEPHVLARTGPSSVPAEQASRTAVCVQFPSLKAVVYSQPQRLTVTRALGGILGKATLLFLGTSFCNSDFTS